MFGVVLSFLVPLYLCWSLKRSYTSEKKKLVLFAFSLSFKLGMDKRSETCSFQLLDMNVGNSSVLQVSDGGCVCVEEQQVMLWDYSVPFSSEQVQLYEAGR